ncbi:porin [Telluribacter sp. SYSU D00476]|uniref:porin n=1 Tax=Telluribacter sp. SYSU D00476 TaxID=2811430 RepID=UPI001FF547DB|nr:porin [Telluribacter sp. SYSU D00476]
MKQFLSAILGVYTLSSSLTFAQTDSTRQQTAEVTVAGFVDAYYAYDFNKPATSYRQPFLYNHNRHNEFNLNLGLVKVGIEHSRYRANLALQTGTYPNDNYAAEPGTLKNIFEANVGIALSRTGNLWLDAGVFASHIGFESAISLDNWTLTRSLLAENSPYFLTGAKLSYQPHEAWQLQVLVLNGWQRIQRLPGNSLPSFGTQVNYSPAEAVVLNWSTFIGTDDPDTTRRMRYFNNFYGQFQLSPRVGLIAGFDVGVQQRTQHSSSYDAWLSPVLIARYTFTDNWAAALRAEYYQDPTGIIIRTGTPNSFKTAGVSMNLDYTPVPNMAWRIEGRWLNSRDRLFERGSSFVADNIFIVTSLAVRFGKSVED